LALIAWAFIETAMPLSIAWTATVTGPRRHLAYLTTGRPAMPPVNGHDLTVTATEVTWQA